VAIRLVDLALLTPAGHPAKLALNTLGADFDRMASPCAGLTRASIAREGSATTGARPSRARGSSQAAPAPHDGSRTSILVRPSRCLTRYPPQYLKTPHQLLAFVRRCQAPPKRGQHSPRVCRRRIRHRSQRELALSLPAAEPIECLVAMGDNAITTVNRVKDRALPLRHGAASRYVKNSRNPRAARADIDITAHRSEVRSRIGPHQFAARDQTDPAACGPPRLRRTLANPNRCLLLI
jgi:hypothetical protein